ncbi:zinc finger CCHC-type containing 10 [Rhinolophus ferrumequinum]|uniref:Zinc finger CCHC-type containing 10 n=1 Tax=Rhinolophus ferrumequinum TaxID=59479 RepID=A0A7J7RZK7_RHIFE|nr:zinc finger CCHC-type containing 10 [Rhinolophus ferrumequinum]
MHRKKKIPTQAFKNSRTKESFKRKRKQIIITTKHWRN